MSIQVKSTCVALIALLLTSCVSEPQLEKKTYEQALVEDLVVQVRLAVTALAKRYNPTDSQLPWRLKLSETKVKISTSMETTDTGGVKLLVSAGGSQKGKDENYIELTMSAPDPYAEDAASDSISMSLLGPSRDAFFSESVATIRSAEIAARNYTDLRCDEPPRRAISSGDGNAPFWEDVVDLTIAGADGFMCAGLASDSLPVELHNLAINVAFTATGSTTVGFKFKVWKVELGSSTATELVTGNFITMTFVPVQNSGA